MTPPNSPRHVNSEKLSRRVMESHMLKNAHLDEQKMSEFANLPKDEAALVFEEMFEERAQQIREQKLIKKASLPRLKKAYSTLTLKPPKKLNPLSRPFEIAGSSLYDSKDLISVSKVIDPMNRLSLSRPINAMDASQASTRQGQSRHESRQGQNMETRQGTETRQDKNMETRQVTETRQDKNLETRQGTETRQDKNMETILAKPVIKRWNETTVPDFVDPWAPQKTPRPQRTLRKAQSQMFPSKKSSQRLSSTTGWEAIKPISHTKDRGPLIAKLSVETRKGGHEMLHVYQVYYIHLV